MEKLMPRVKRGRYILIPTSEQTRGHGTHSLPAIWGKHLAELCELTAPPCRSKRGGCSTGGVVYDNGIGEQQRPKRPSL